MVWEEAELVVDRLNRRHATDATLLRLAVSSMLSKEAGELFSKRVAELSGSDG